MKSSNENLFEGRVVATRGRRVLVRDSKGDERVCFLSGRRAVVGDRVLWSEAQGEGGKLSEVLDRKTQLVRVDFKGRTQVLAANLGGLLIVTTPSTPPFREGLLDRYLVAAYAAELEPVVCLNKSDLGVPSEVEEVLRVREESGVRVLRVSAGTGDGMDVLATELAKWSADAPWALVGHSGVGKTSLVRSLMPGQEVGEVGEVSSHWGTGQHTTTGSRLFELPGGGQLVDSPGIRTFAPAGIEAADVRRLFPAVSELVCKYRGCRHREGEDGCAGPDEVPASLLASYRRLFYEIERLERRR